MSRASNCVSTVANVDFKQRYLVNVKIDGKGRKVCEVKGFRTLSLENSTARVPKVGKFLIQIITVDGSMSSSETIASSASI
jgi:hypothetical protein